jgi:hypothetical protein
MPNAKKNTQILIICNTDTFLKILLLFVFHFILRLPFIKFYALCHINPEIILLSKFEKRLKIRR